MKLPERVVPLSLRYAEKYMATEIRGDSMIRRAEEWLSAWVGEELVMMSADTGTCISLSPTGGRTWELLETPRQLDSLVDELVHEYGSTDDEVRPDVLTFLDRLHKEGGITVGESTTA